VIFDLQTVLWKEWRSLIAGRARRQLILTGGILVFYAILFPIQMGAEWVSDPIPMGIVGIVLPMVIVGVVVPDSIAGERERRTLSTLLASRLPDRAILYGKLGFAVAIGWLAAPIVLAIALVVVNLVVGRPRLLMYEPSLLLAVLVLAFLVAVLTGGIGVFVSLRARTAQEAQQLTLLGLLVPGMLIGFAVTILLGNRELGAGLINWLATVDVGRVALGAMAVLALIDALIVLAADRRFRRGRLISA
jgi:ABC-2 type transport system permease protein